MSRASSGGRTRSARPAGVTARARSWRVGDVYLVPVIGGRFGCAWLLGMPSVAFFDPGSDPNLEDPASLVAGPTLFTLMARTTALRSWRYVGSLPLDSRVVEHPFYFKQDVLTGVLTKIRAGAEISATRDECLQLERAAVWEPDHIKERLEDQYAGRQNY